MMLAYYLVVAFASITFTALAILVIRSRKSQRSLGVQLLQALRMLVKHIQIHRGLMVTYIGGRTDTADSIVLNADTISVDMKNIVRLEVLISDNEDWDGITRHWARLSSPANAYDALDNYEQHCKLVASCLELMVWVSQQYKIHEYFRAGERLYWYELLSLGETLGQLRALGMMYLTMSQDHTSNSKCIRKIKSCLLDVEMSFTNKQFRDKIGAIQCEEISTFLALVEHYIVGNKSWITSDQYFSRATETIEIIYKNFDEELQHLLRLY